MNNENTEAVKSVSAGSIVLWLLGILTIIIGLAGGYVAVIIAGVILLPIVNTLTKKHLKINFSGMARFVIAVILIIGGTVMSSSIDEARQAIDSQSGGSESAPQEEVWTEIYTLKGKGNQDSESFNVTSKKVRVTATTCCGSSSSGSFSGVSLEKENGGYTGPGLHISTSGSEQGEGQTTYRGMAPGLYYVQVISGVNWEVKVEQTN
ncbi:hypothetical protein A3D62_02495 [Candidatus Kaiserbacteria bacterium RIFCSPHIGHO2_02_FULL_49_11]|uniref:Uncharacterized protein n=2 Tax=Parcubacteria group TaxID=1794811 RepID=A0A1G2QD38_9BACT|nr:MAG: hypothetical protein A3D62_02495 [Candidatus Kaiserbacteria bacterium RIFCSPHIGHO2_02_FULL_49_11]OHA58476.1 MAG: hypothetical protein A2571_01720 [Candidatus Vogelbacteria bacterium RIFOXYD1_FULL_44_32]